MIRARVLVPVAAFLLFALTLARVHTWDALAYTARIHGDPILSERYLSTSFFHPHHLLYDELGVVFVKLWHLVTGGVDAPPFVPLQLMSAVFGSLCVLLILLIPRRRAIMTAATFAACNTVWLFSTAVEVMLPALFFFLLSLYLVRAETVPLPRVLAAAALAALSVLVHQIAILACVALAYYVTARDRKAGAWFCAGLVVLVGVVYVMVGRVVLTDFGVVAMIEWATSAGERTVSGTMSLGDQILTSARGLVHAFVSPFGPDDLRQGVRPLAGLVLAIASGTVLIAGLVLVAGAFVRLPGLLRDHDPWPRFLLVWIGLVAVFIIWFQPSNIEYWIYCVPPALFLCGSGVRLRRLTASILISLLAVVNFSTSIQPRLDTTNASYRETVDMVAATLRPGDTIIAGLADHGGFDGSELLAIPLHTGVDAVTLSDDQVADVVNDAFAQARRVFVRESIVSSLPGRYEFTPSHGAGSWRLLEIHPPR